MNHKVARLTVLLLFVVFLTTSTFAQVTNVPTDPKAAAAQAKADKKAAEQAAKDAKNDAKKPKNSNVDDIGNRDINKGNKLPTMSLEKEIAMGRQMAAEVEREVKLFDDPVVNEYVNRVGQNIVRNSDAKVPFTIKVVDSDEVNAFAIPGGFFYVNTGLIMAADEEAELAGVMAHEIGHVAARHGAETASKQTFLNIASIPLIFLGGPVGYGIRQAAGLTIPLGLLKFTRSEEEEADYLGVQYSYKTGYDPSAIVGFFEKLQAKEKAKPGTMANLFSTHPPTAARVEKTKDTIEHILEPRDQYVVTTSEFDRVKSRLVSLENRKPVDDENGQQGPSLKRKSSGSKGTDSDADGTTTTTSKSGSSKPDDREPSDDDRPTLKRKQ